MKNRINLPDDWSDLLREEFSQAYFTDLIDFVDGQYAAAPGMVFPPRDEIFSAFELCSVENLQVVILGQDPYHGKGQANGLCFSVSRDVKKLPPSLVNIFKCVAANGFTTTPENGDLGRWARQGVLLLNTVLTVAQGVAFSHRDRGWETFTDAVIRKINKSKQGVVFMLWGKPAQRKRRLIDESRHSVLTTSHPSPLSVYRGFSESKCFEQANKLLNRPIEW